jgi:hypothetical protein
VDQQGHTYISGPHDIHRLSPDGTFRDIVLSKHDGVDRPRGITFNNDFTKLFIINGGGFMGGKTVLVFYMKYIIGKMAETESLLSTCCTVLFLLIINSFISYC